MQDTICLAETAPDCTLQAAGGGETALEGESGAEHGVNAFYQDFLLLFQVWVKLGYTVCPGSSDSPEKIFNIFASENEVYNIY